MHKCTRRTCPRTYELTDEQRGHARERSCIQPSRTEPSQTRAQVGSDGVHARTRPSSDRATGRGVWRGVRAAECRERTPGAATGGGMNERGRRILQQWRGTGRGRKCEMRERRMPGRRIQIRAAGSRCKIEEAGRWMEAAGSGIQAQGARCWVQNAGRRMRTRARTTGGYKRRMREGGYKRGIQDARRGMHHLGAGRTE